MFGEKVRVRILSIFSLKFWRFYKKVAKKTFIKYPYIRGLKNLYKYLFVYSCLDDINKTFNLYYKLQVDDFKFFNSLYNLCKDWENGKVNNRLIAYINKG